MNKEQQQGCVGFRQAYTTFNAFPLAPEIWQSQAYQDYVEHMHDCSACSDWYMEQVVKSRGYDPEEFACVHVAFHGTLACDVHNDPFDCPDVLVLYDSEDKTYALPVRDALPARESGRSFVPITYCPWCGVALPNGDVIGTQRIKV